MTYPSHIYDPIRIKIAQQYLMHEFHKLFPSIKDQTVWDLINTDVENWFDHAPGLAPVRDFWNGVDGISRGFKLKHIVARLTSAHIHWTYEEFPINQLVFTAAFEAFEKLGPNLSASKIIDYLNKNADGKALKDASLQTLNDLSQKLVVRNQEPVIISGKDNVFQIIDGNRRSWEALLNNKPTIYAAVGRVVQDPAIFNIWLPTPLLMDLVAYARHIDQSEFALETMSDTITLLIKDSQSGQYEFFNRATSNKDVQIKEKVQQKLTKLKI